MVRLSPTPPQPQAAIVIPQDRPVYRIKDGKFFGPDDHLYEAGAIIAWTDEPNLEMEPLNALAQENYKKFLQKLDKAGREVAEKTGKAYTSLADSHAQAMELAKVESKGGFEALNVKKQIPLMGAKKKVDSIEEVNVTGAVSTPLLAEPKRTLGKGEMVDKE